MYTSRLPFGVTLALKTMETFSFDVIIHSLLSGNLMDGFDRCQESTAPTRILWFGGGCYSCKVRAISTLMPFVLVWDDNKGHSGVRVRCANTFDTFL